MADDNDAGTRSRRAPAAVPVAVMLVVAVLAVTPVLLFGGARLPDRPEPAAAEVAMPELLAAGIPPAAVPDAVAAAADGPVVGAVRVERLPDGVPCDHEGVFDEEPELEQALVGPFGLTATFVGVGAGFEPPPPPRGVLVPQPAQPERLRATCEAAWDGTGWTGGGQSVGPADHPEAGGVHGVSCCDAGGAGTATASLPLAEDVAWALHDQGGWWVAYPVEDASFVTVQWKFVARGGAFGDRGPVVTSTVVLLLDADGDVIEEAVLSA